MKFLIILTLQKHFLSPFHLFSTIHGAMIYFLWTPLCGLKHENM